MTTPSHSLLDVQGLPDTRGVALQHAGVRQVEMPLQLLQKDGGTQTVAAAATMSVLLGAEAKGTHMSRFVLQLAEWSRDKAFSLNLREYLEDMRLRLEAPASRLVLDFKYFVMKHSPVSDYCAPVAIPVQFVGALGPTGEYRFELGLTLATATVCPCSKAISKYGAHNQRAEIRVRLLLDTEHDHPVVWIEDMVTALDACGSCPTYPVLKRTDEKYVTERGYENPKFVEDVAREATLMLRSYPGVKGFDLEVEAFESIHAHNAWAAHRENFPEMAWPTDRIGA